MPHYSEILYNVYCDITTYMSNSPMDCLVSCKYVQDTWDVTETCRHGMLLRPADNALV